MKEIGGYIEMEYNHGTLFHDSAIRLNCGRSCLEYLVETYGIKKIWLPLYLCDSVSERCKLLGLDIAYYGIGGNFSIEKPEINDKDWLYVVNYFGHLTPDDIRSIKTSYKNVICDNAQAFFQLPVENVPTLYTCRKFFGVSDGAFLYSDNIINRELELDESRDRISFLLGRFEKEASEFYPEYVKNNELFSGQKIKKMSKLTENMLRGIDYGYIKKRREENWIVLHDKLKNYNMLELSPIDGPFSYPLYNKKGEEIRRKLIEKKIYIPMLWPNVIKECSYDSFEYDYAKNILPLPCDQRYNYEDMDYVADAILEMI